MGFFKRAVETSLNRSHTVATNEDLIPGLIGRRTVRSVFRIATGFAMVGTTIGSAILTKELGASVPALAAVKTVAMHTDASDHRSEPVPARILAAPEASPQASLDVSDEPEATENDPGADLDEETLKLALDPRVRWFNARPVRPARQYWMTVTGYSPDARSCGDSADGLTATLHPVQTNNMKLVAADTSILPYGSMVSVPGYDSGEVVPVLDCGSAIKGRRLDLLFPTHEQARTWGRQRVRVTVWENADGKPMENPRKAR